MAAASRELRALVDSGTTEGASALATQLDDLFLAVKAALTNAATIFGTAGAATRSEKRSNVGAEPMAAASRELRALVDSGTTEGASALATQLDDLFLAVKAALEAKLEKDYRDDVVSA